MANPGYMVAGERTSCTIERNGAPLKTPGGAALVLPTQNLAEAITEELRAEAKEKPLMQLASTAIDVVMKARHKITDEIAAYAATELLCHRAEQPPELIKAQQDIWQPVLDWCAQRFGSLLRSGVGIMPIAQPEESLSALRAVVASFDDFRLTGLSEAVRISGSLVLGLALAERHFSAEQVFAAAELDATHQMEKWGADPAIQKRRETIRRDIELVEQWFGLL